jgi:hypothetical protein
MLRPLLGIPPGVSSKGGCARAVGVFRPAGASHPDWPLRQPVRALCDERIHPRDVGLEALMLCLQVLALHLDHREAARACLRPQSLVLLPCRRLRRVIREKRIAHAVLPRSPSSAATCKAENVNVSVMPQFVGPQAPGALRYGWSGANVTLSSSWAPSSLAVSRQLSTARPRKVLEARNSASMWAWSAATPGFK